MTAISRSENNIGLQFGKRRKKLYKYIKDIHPFTSKSQKKIAYSREKEREISRHR